MNEPKNDGIPPPAPAPMSAAEVELIEFGIRESISVAKAADINGTGRTRALMWLRGLVRADILKAVGKRWRPTVEGKKLLRRYNHWKVNEKRRLSGLPAFS